MKLSVDEELDREEGWLLGLTTLFIFVFFSCPTIAQECGGNFHSLEGRLFSPNYPANYSNNMECTYFISLPAAYRITLTFDEFELEERPEPSELCVDYIEVYDGSSHLSPRLSRASCGTEMIDRRTRTTQSKMWIRFRSNDRVTYPGFNASYSSDLLGDFFAIMATPDYMVRVDMRTATLLTIQVKVYNPTAMDYDYLNQRIYFTERNDTNIFAVFLNGTHVKRVAHLKEVAVINDIAVDSASRLVFYAGSSNGTIGVVTSSGTWHKRLISTDLLMPNSLALDTKSGVLFWTDGNKIQRANYDGSDRRTLLELKVARTTLRSITIDEQIGHLYWLHVDSVDDITIESSDLDGNGRTVNFFTSTEDFHVLQLFFYNSRLYLLSEGTYENRVVNRVYHHVRGSSWAYSRVGIYGQILDVVLFDSSVRYETKSCQIDNGRCSHFCIPSSGNRAKCMCPDDLILSENNLTCTETTVAAAQEDDTDNTALIGGIVGAVCFIVLIIIVCVICKRKGSRTKTPAFSMPMRNRNEVATNPARLELQFDNSPTARPHKGRPDRMNVIVNREHLQVVMAVADC